MWAVQGLVMAPATPIARFYSGQRAQEDVHWSQKVDRWIFSWVEEPDEVSGLRE